MDEHRIKYAWKCGECGYIHDDEDDARECCMPDILEVVVCRLCGKTHRLKEDAMQCCADSEEPVQPDPRELEQAGQERLF